MSRVLVLGHFCVAFAAFLQRMGS